MTKITFALFSNSDRSAVAAANEVENILVQQNAHQISRPPSKQLSLGATVIAVVVSGTGVAIANGIFALLKQRRSVTIEITTEKGTVMVSNATLSEGEAAALRMIKEAI